MFYLYVKHVKFLVSFTFKGDQMSIWELQSDSVEYTMMRELISQYHQHLGEAKILLYATDKNKVKDQNVVFAEVAKAPPRLKVSTGADFTITLRMMPWGDLSIDQKKACLDHQLSHCGVQYEPLKERVGNKMKVIKDEYGRKQLSNDIQRDENGVPKWKISTHDVEEFKDIIARHGIQDDNIQTLKDLLDRVTEDAVH